MEQIPQPEQPENLLPKVSEGTFDAFSRDIQSEKPEKMIEYLRTIEQENPELDLVLKNLVFDDKGKIRSGSEDVLTTVTIVYFALRKQAEADKLEQDFEGKTTPGNVRLVPKATKETVDIMQKEFENWAKRQGNDSQSYCLKNLEPIKQENPEIGRFLDERMRKDGVVQRDKILSSLMGVMFYQALRKQAEADQMMRDFKGN